MYFHRPVPEGHYDYRSGDVKKQSMNAAELPVLPGPMWGRLHMHSHLANTVEDIHSNIEAAIARGYVSLHGLIGSQRGAASVVGSGPSLKENWKKLERLHKRGVPIIACNAAFQFLLERGITPEYFFCFDADPLMLEFMTPVKGVKYLLASRCPPRAFELIEGCEIYVWHAQGDPDIESILVKHKRYEPMINGGSAAVVRAMSLAEGLGFKKIHVWGGDSSFKNKNTHIRKSTTDERNMFVNVNKRAFEIAPWMARQVEDFKILAPSLQAHQGVKIIVHGDSLLSHVAKTMGIETDSEPQYKQYWRNMKMKSQLFWKAL